MCAIGDRSQTRSTRSCEALQNLSVSSEIREQRNMEGGCGGGVQIIAWSSSSDNIGAFASFKVKQFAAVV